MGFEQRVEILDATAGELGLTMGDLGEEREGVGTEVEDLLPLLVELGALAVQGGDLGRAMLGEGRRRLAFLPAAMKDLEATRDDAETLLVEEERARDVRRLRRHRVRQSLEHHLGGRADEDRNAQRELVRKHLDWPEAHELLQALRFRNYPRRARGGTGVDLMKPGVELIAEIGFVLELAVFEEGAFDPADEPLDGAFLIAAARRAHLDAATDVDDGLREGGIPRLDVATFSALLYDGLRSIENREERQSAEGDEVTREAADDRLGALVFDERDRDEASST